MLELSDVSVAYGNIQALHGIDLVARPGEITAVLGANGAGKVDAIEIDADARINVERKVIRSDTADKRGNHRRRTRERGATIEIHVRGEKAQR